MNYNKHSSLEGQHAFLSASKYHWINYDDDKIASSYTSLMTKVRGTELHEFACQCIRLGQKLPRSKKTLNAYVNDAIGYRMVPEQILVYSENCFGTVDSISTLDQVVKTGLLRIHDLKTGATPAKMEQLYIYAALFCLEYKFKPEKLDFELRIYQNDEVMTDFPTAETIKSIMEKIISADKIITKCREQGV